MSYLSICAEHFPQSSGGVDTEDIGAPALEHSAAFPSNGYQSNADQKMNPQRVIIGGIHIIRRN